MEIPIRAALWVVGRALGPVTDGVLESWAASSELGTNVRDLKLELLYAQGMLNSARGRDVSNPALTELLLELRHQAYKADDVLDELEYFRIQDELEGTYETTDNHGLVHNARHTAKAVARKLIKLPSCSCASLREGAVRAPKLKFDRVKMSRAMKGIVEQLRPLCAKVATILELEILGPNRSMTQGTDLSNRPITSQEIIQPNLYGRDDPKQNVVDSFTDGKYSSKDLAVLSIVGPGGIGKTTFTQHIYHRVKSQFDVSIWVCVSHDFNANRLAKEIVQKLPISENEKHIKGDEELIAKRLQEKDIKGDEELIAKRLQSKKFLLVLDDIWEYQDGEWKKFIASLKKGGTQGNVVIVTTRIPKVAKMVATTGCLITLKRLEDKDCMKLLQECVFDDQQSWEHHATLRAVGEQIVTRLKGSPLSKNSR
ncbi:hypothetical protein ACP4OV_020085 [Aristida adscensionis]